MNIAERHSTLAAELAQLRQAIADATVRAHRLEGAVAILDEQLKEQHDGDTNLPSGD